MTKALDKGLPILTIEFIKDHLRFGPAIPEEIKIKLCSDVIEFADVFSWNAFDLGCIRDVPMGISRFDPSPARMPSKRHLDNPVNKEIIKAKCWPLVELMIYKKAPPQCIDRAPIVRTAPTVELRNDFKYCRIAHDYQLLNDRVNFDPEPVDSILDMLALMGMGETGSFLKIDADRGFHQIVMTEEAIQASAFEFVGE